MNEMERFNIDVVNNKEMMEEVKKLGNNIEKIVEFANLKGYKFTVEDIKEEVEKRDALSEDDLENVAGGTGRNNNQSSNINPRTGIPIGATVIISVISGFSY